jgi:hypothetical protein
MLPIEQMLLLHAHFSKGRRGPRARELIRTFWILDSWLWESLTTPSELAAKWLVGTFLAAPIAGPGETEGFHP